MQNYLDTLDKIITEGVDKANITGSGVGVGRRSLFNVNLEFDISEKFPLLTARKLNFSKIFTELAWMMSGMTNIRNLVLRGCNYWDYNAYDYYLKQLSYPPDMKVIPEDHEKLSFPDFIDKIRDTALKELHFGDEYVIGRYRLGDLGSVYGEQIRAYAAEFTGYGSAIDQLAGVLDGIIHDPEGSRHLVTMWNPYSNPYNAIPACHHSFQFYLEPFLDKELEAIVKGVKIKMEKLLKTTQTKADRNYYKKIYDSIVEGTKTNREICQQVQAPMYKMNLKFHMRSNDFVMGAPSNIAFYALLNHLVCKAIGLAVPNKVVMDVTDCHIYHNHIEKAKVMLQREPRELPTLYVTPAFKSLNHLLKAEELMYTYLDAHLLEPQEKQPIRIENYNPHAGISFPFNGLNPIEVYK